MNKSEMNSRVLEVSERWRVSLAEAKDSAEAAACARKRASEAQADAELAGQKHSAVRAELEQLLAEHLSTIDGVAIGPVPAPKAPPEGTIVQKVEIVITSNQSPSRIARAVHEELSKLAENRLVPKEPA